MTALDATPALTTVELYWLKDRLQRWIRFGPIADEQVLDRRRRVVAFRPGVIFAYVRWAANDTGHTAVSRIDILRTVSDGQPYSTVPFVSPGAEILLRAHGWPKVERVLQAVDAVEALGLDPADAAPAYWRHVHNRLAAGLSPRDYTLDRHRAWLLRRRVKP